MLAERVNASERERGRLNQQKELLAAVDGLALVCVCVFVHCSVCMKVGWAEYHKGMYVWSLLGCL